MGKKTIITVLIVLAVIGIGWRLFHDDEREIRAVLNELQESFARDPSKNLMEKAVGILKITRRFTPDFTGEIDRTRVRGEGELKHAVSWMIQFLAPIITRMEIESIDVDGDRAEVRLEVAIEYSASPESHAPLYRLEVILARKKRDGLVASVTQK
jgi:hypothetical protein